MFQNFFENSNWKQKLFWLTSQLWSWSEGGFKLKSSEELYWKCLRTHTIRNLVHGEWIIFSLVLFLLLSVGGRGWRVWRFVKFFSISFCFYPSFSHFFCSSFITAENRFITEDMMLSNIFICWHIAVIQLINNH